MRSTRPLFRTLVFGLAGLSAALVGPSATAEAAPAEEVKILVLKENGVGGRSTAQAYVDALVKAVGDRNGWASVSGIYMTSLKTARAWIKANSPSFGIMTLPGFLAMRKSEGLTVLGQAVVKAAGGRQYHIISKTQTGLDGCKGKTLASDHADDPHFIDTVVAGGDFTLADFTFVATTRPVQTLKQISRGEAECALIDDAQLSSLDSLDGTEGVQSVWKSAKLPPMVVVAFGSVPAGKRGSFRTLLPQVCLGPGKKACDEAGIGSLRVASDLQYAKLIKAYGD